MRKDQDSAVEALVEQLIEGGSENMATVFAGLFNLAMRIERERFLGAGHYERTPERRGYANGTRPKMVLSRFSSGYLIASLAIKETDHGTTIR